MEKGAKVESSQLELYTLQKAVRQVEGTSNGDQQNGQMEQNGAGDCDGDTGESQQYQFLANVYQFLVSRSRHNIDVESKVVDYKEPEKLARLIDLEITQHGQSDDQLLQLVKKVCELSVNTSHPHFFNQLFAGTDEYAVAGSAVTDVMNSSSYTYEMAPVFTLQERHVFKKMIKLVGWDDGDGLFCPGGSMSNMYGLHCARHHYFPQAKSTGLHSLPPLCVFTSTHSHYSLEKGVAFLGIGLDNLVAVECDREGRMSPARLEEAIQKAIAEGKHPMVVNVTSGTTVLGAFDPIPPIADLCDKYGMWLHVDGAFGSSVLLSRQHRHLMEGCERADSLSWNTHKMLGITQQCSSFLTRHKNLLKPTFSANAQYLFQQDKFYDIQYDAGDASLQCGRKVDVLKLWLTWKKHGDLGMEKKVDRAFDNARYLADKIKRTEGFRLVFEPQCVNVGFWYIPPSLRGQKQTPDFWDRLAQVAPKIKERMVREGTTMIGYQPRGELVNFFRMVVINPCLTHADMDFVVDEVARLGHDL